MEAEKLSKILELHKKWINHEPGGEQANLVEADLRRADLEGADLKGANLDYSCWPLWCGSLGVRVCKRIAAQLAYHFCRLVCDDPEVIAAQNALIPLANQFRRVDDCGKIELKEIP
ncbi:MAG: pentapeptide repeat-containing protein [Acutalibacter sp.]